MDESAGSNFIRDIIEDDLSRGRHKTIQTRFPPEPNGYLHIGHAKAICANFGLAELFGGSCNLRFDDTNPTRENDEFVRTIQEDVRWLGFDWGERPLFASDYFEQLYEWALALIRGGYAYVEDLSAEEIREYRGTLTEPGRNSPHRDRPIEESLDLFARMRAGEFAEGTHALRAKIDMASPNINLRDPVLYRIQHAHHHRTGDAWCIYPMYDFAHGQSDSIERITHSLCTLEFEAHRPLYDWLIAKLGIYAPRQIEFARLELTHTMLSKRKLKQLVEEQHVDGWDDPRMPTLSGLRRRGYTPEAIRAFCDNLGLSKANSTADLGMLEYYLRQDLNERSNRYMAVLRPLKVIIENYPQDQVETLTASNHPKDPDAGTRSLTFSRELWVERSDFLEEPPKKFWRLAPGREVRLRYGYLVTCTGFRKDPDSGEILEVHCTYDPETRGGNAPDGRKVRGTIHWVSAAAAIDAKVHLYENLFERENPDAVPEGESFLDGLRSDSRTTLEDAKLEPVLAEDPPVETVQFERQGYFKREPTGDDGGGQVWHRTVTLRDSWSKIEKKRGPGFTS
jgi:glutaminyl-tRNA synthetase